jgi:hypothetical protein
MHTPYQTTTKVAPGHRDVRVNRLRFFAYGHSLSQSRRYLVKVAVAVDLVLDDGLLPHGGELLWGSKRGRQLQSRIARSTKLLRPRRLDFREEADGFQSSLCNKPTKVRAERTRTKKKKKKKKKRR